MMRKYIEWLSPGLHSAFISSISHCVLYFIYINKGLKLVQFASLINSVKFF